MGIDARMIAVVHGVKPSSTFLTKLSWLLCEAIGSNKFWISAGLKGQEFSEASVKWREAFNTHALNKEFNEEHDHDKRDALYGRILADIGDPPEQHRAALALTNERYPLTDDDYDVPVEYRQPGKAYLQDGAPMLAKQHEWFIEVSLCGRWYGVGYEQGDLLTYCAIAEWLECNIENEGQPPAIYYGGDSSGAEATPFDDKARAMLRKHLYSQGGCDYFHYSKPVNSPMPCSLCIPDEARCSQYGSGRGGLYSAVHCAGCGKSFETNNGGKKWTVKEGE